MRRPTAFLRCGLLVITVAACGGVTTTPGATSNGGAPQGEGGQAVSSGGAGANSFGEGTAATFGGGTGGASTGGGPALARNPACPVEIPESGSPCSASDPAVSCEYRTAGKPAWCITSVGCDPLGDGSVPNPSYGWQVASCLANAPDCPSSYAAASGATCTTQGNACGYDEGSCNCGQCWRGAPGTPDSSTALQWNCATWAGNCQSPRPLFGDACDPSLEGTSCNECSASGPAMQCKDGYWEAALPAPCPPFTVSCTTPYYD